MGIDQRTLKWGLNTVIFKPFEYSEILSFSSCYASTMFTRRSTVPLETNFLHIDIVRGRSVIQTASRTYVECREIILRETGSFKLLNSRVRSSSNEENAVLEAVEYNPRVSTRQISRQSGISQSSVTSNCSRPCKMHSCSPVHLHQELHGSKYVYSLPNGFCSK